MQSSRSDKELQEDVLDELRWELGVKATDIAAALSTVRTRRHPRPDDFQRGMGLIYK
jgi:hypothetical protein